MNCHWILLLTLGLCVNPCAADEKAPKHDSAAVASLISRSQSKLIGQIELSADGWAATWSCMAKEGLLKGELKLARVGGMRPETTIATTRLRAGHMTSFAFEFVLGRERSGLRGTVKKGQVAYERFQVLRGKGDPPERGTSAWKPGALTLDAAALLLAQLPDLPATGSLWVVLPPEGSIALAHWKRQGRSFQIGPKDQPPLQVRLDAKGAIDQVDLGGLVLGRVPTSK